MEMEFEFDEEYEIQEVEKKRVWQAYFIVMSLEKEKKKKGAARSRGGK